ncbi:MAG: glutamylcysteine synthetase [Lachnospiraceae bacterium]|nr:glutamylcysteine synthetase [Lachnospiraceae bacterium]
MENSVIRKLLYEKYIAPTKRKKKGYIGIEIEMPLLNLKKEAVDFSVVHKVTKVFMEKFSFEVEGCDDEGNIYAAINTETGDILSYDCSYNNLELSLGREKKLHAIYQRFCCYYTFLKKEFETYHHTLTGMGINPYRKYNHNIPIPNGRYRMLFHHLNSYSNYNIPKYFHSYPEYGLFSSASQVQLDVEYEKLLTTIETFSRLEPIKAVLFSNSILLEEEEQLQCCRDMFWEDSTHGINPHNVGMFDCDFESVEDLLSYLETFSMYCVEKDGKYINFPPIPLQEYFKKRTMTGEYFDGNGYQKIEFAPEPCDLEYLRTFKFEDLTFRGTIEFRSVCCQPIGDCMTVAAFHLGLQENLEQLTELLKKDTALYHHGYTAAELRRMFTYVKYPSFVSEENLYDLLHRIVDLAKDGLMKRSFGEEIYLEPLYKRIQKRTNPAREILAAKEKGIAIEEMIQKYSEL